MIKKKDIKEKAKRILKASIQQKLNTFVFCDLFDNVELLEMILEAVKQWGAWIDERELSSICKMQVLENNAFIVKSVDLVQEKELKDFCKAKDIKLIDAWDL